MADFSGRNAKSGPIRSPNNSQSILAGPNRMTTRLTRHLSHGNRNIDMRSFVRGLLLTVGLAGVCGPGGMVRADQASTAPKSQAAQETSRQKSDAAAPAVTKTDPTRQPPRARLRIADEPQTRPLATPLKSLEPTLELVDQTPTVIVSLDVVGERSDPGCGKQTETTIQLSSPHTTEEADMRMVLDPGPRAARAPAPSESTAIIWQQVPRLTIQTSSSSSPSTIARLWGTTPSPDPSKASSPAVSANKGSRRRRFAAAFNAN